MPKPVELLDGPRQHPGLRAVDDLQRWLTLSIAEVARLTGVAESTIYWWKQHPTSTVRPAKVDRLLGLHALAGGLVDGLGEDGARRWFRFGNPSPLARLRSERTALPAIEQEGYDLLLEQARRTPEGLTGWRPGYRHQVKDIDPGWKCIDCGHEFQRWPSDAEECPGPKGEEMNEWCECNHPREDHAIRNQEPLGECSFGSCGCTMFRDIDPAR